MEVLRSRRAIRDYNGARVSHLVIERLISAAVLAPSAMNLQPWAFGVLLDPERIDKYADRARKWLLENFEASGHDARAREILHQPEFDIFYHAPAIVIVLAHSSASQAVEDCCLAAENLLLAARDEGIGSRWIGFARPWLNLPSTKKELGIPSDYEVVAPIILGYPRAWPQTHGRKPPEIHWI
jgi:nitroreductase